VARVLSSASLGLQNLSGTFSNAWRIVTRRFDTSGGMRELVGRFYDSIRTGSEPPISPDECLRVVELTQRIWPAPVAPPATSRATICTSPVSGSVDAFVTGASGFVGTHLVRKLVDEGQRVRVLVRPGSLHAGRMRMLDVEICEADLGNDDALHAASKGARVIFHAGATMTGSWTDHERTTVTATTRLAEAALAHGAEKFVFLSSLAVFETTAPKGAEITEDSPYHSEPRELGPYAWSKIEAEKLLFRMHREQGLPVTVVRPGVVIGPLGPVFFPHLGFRYQDRILAVLGRGNNVLPLTYVENTVDGILRAARCGGAVGGSFNLIDDGEVTVQAYIEKFMAVTGIRPRVIHVPASLPFLAAGLYELAGSMRLVKPGATSRRQLRAKHHGLVFTSGKAKTELGWSTRIPLETGMEATFQWYREKYGPQ
jgi:2-alkyl-3-oxoalkanoate reductase